MCLAGWQGCDGPGPLLLWPPAPLAKGSFCQVLSHVLGTQPEASKPPAVETVQPSCVLSSPSQGRDDKTKAILSCSIGVICHAAGDTAVMLPLPSAGQ